MLRSFFAFILLAAPLFAEGDALQPLLDAYSIERKAATGSEEALTVADRLAARAEEARTAENLAGAARFIREARWALPAVPYGLPQGARMLGYNRLRHGERANAVRFSVDGKLLLSTSGDRSVRVWDAATGREVMVYRGHTPESLGEDPKVGISGVPLRVTDAVFLPDGLRVASAGGKQIHVWDLKTGKTLQVFKVENLPKPDPKGKVGVLLIKSVAVNGYGTKLASGSDDKIVRIWDLKTGKETFASNPQSSRIESVAWQPGGKLVAAVDADGFLAVYDSNSDNKSPLMKVKASEGNTMPVYSVRFTPDGAKLLSAGSDKTPWLTPAPGADGTVPPNLAAATVKLPPHDAEILAVDVTKDGKYFVTGGRAKDKGGVVRVADALGQVLRSFTSPSAVTALSVRPDGLQIAAACEDGTLRLWDFLAVDDHRASIEAKEPLWCAAIAPDGKSFATAGADKSLRIYALNGKLLKTLEGATASITSLVYLNDDTIASAGGDKMLRIWDAKAGKAVAEWPGHAAAVLTLAATPDGKLVASGAADKIVNGWNSATGKIAFTWTARSAVTALALTRDGRRLLVGTADGGLTVLKLGAEKPEVIGYANAHISGVAAIGLSADGSRIATAGGDGVPKIWSLPETGAPATLFRMSPALKPTAPAQVALSAAVFSPDGKQVAVGGADGIVRLYDSATGTEARSLRGCTDWITALAYDPSGEKLLAVGADKAARVFDIPRLDFGSRGGHSALARSVAVSKDGKLIASAGDDKTIRLWNAATGAELAAIPCPGEKTFSLVFIGGDRIASGGSDKKVRIWDVATKKLLNAIPVGEIYGITPAADGRTLGVWSRMNDVDTYGIYNADGETKTPLAVVEKGRKVSSAAFAPDLSQVASADDSGAVILHRLAGKPEAVAPWKIAQARIADVGFSPDGKTLIAVDEDGVASIGDVASQKVNSVKDALKEPLNALVISPAGGRFALIGIEGTVRVFDFEGKEVKSFTMPSPANGAAFSQDGMSLVTANADGSLCVLSLP